MDLKMSSQLLQVRNLGQRPVSIYIVLKKHPTARDETKAYKIETTWEPDLGSMALGQPTPINRDTSQLQV